MQLKDILAFKNNGILNLDNCLVINGFTEEEVQALLPVIEESGYKSMIIDCKFTVDPNHSFESNAIFFIYSIQTMRETIIANPDTVFLLMNFNQFYMNEATKVLERSNPKFLLWYLSYNLPFNPIMYINRNENAQHYGLVNINGATTILKSYERGIEEIEKIYQEYLKQRE